MQLEEKERTSVQANRAPLGGRLPKVDFVGRASA